MGVVSPLEIAELIEIQNQLAQNVILRYNFQSLPKFVVGIDLAFKDEHAFAAGVVMTFPELQKVTSRVSVHKLSFPYIPGFLAFREGPAILEMIESFALNAELILINAHGIAHPRFCGCASHVGLLSDTPTIGVASRILCGYYDRAHMSDNQHTAPLILQNRQVGWVLRAHQKSHPIIISPGHKVDMTTCLKVVKACIMDHKLPEPLWYAHRLANIERDACQLI